MHPPDTAERLQPRCGETRHVWLLRGEPPHQVKLRTPSPLTSPHKKSLPGIAVSACIAPPPHPSPCSNPHSTHTTHLASRRGNPWLCMLVVGVRVDTHTPLLTYLAIGTCKMRANVVLRSCVDWGMMMMRRDEHAHTQDRASEGFTSERVAAPWCARAATTHTPFRREPPAFVCWQTRTPMCPSRGTRPGRGGIS